MITFKAVPVKEVGPKGKGPSRKNAIRNIINAFIASNHQAVEVFYDECEYANTNNFRKSFQNTLDSMNITSIHVTIRGNRVFLVKED